jgi:4-diphosphocytidyl-2-C-methyl-D-erythritol kinase
VTTYTRAIVQAQAKLNLRLRILARESSGYHGIETLFHKIALADTVDVTLDRAGARTIECDVDVGPPARNLAARAADAFLSQTGWETGYTIRLTKRIPAGGGLGGGSADAGATLRALNALAPHPIPSADLLTLAAPLGADVPFLTSEAPMALAWDRGGRMLALDPLPTRYVVLVVPEFRVATADAYEWLAAERAVDDYTTAGAAMLLHPWHLANWGELRQWCQNDFEPTIAHRHPTITRILGTLRGHGATVAGMTGSGSTLFGIFDQHPDAAQLESATSEKILVTKTADGVEAVRLID